MYNLLNIRLLTFLFSLLSVSQFILGQTTVFPGADEQTPSKAQYFSWINNTNEGATEAQTQTNLAFFKWLKDEYGMQLDIYAFDAGALDGKRFYGSTQSNRFKKQFPFGFDSVYQKAMAQGIRLGIWGGPDGFGQTEKEIKDRTEQMVELCQRYQFALFKFDAVCGPLRPEMEDAFITMMENCRKYSIDLILLNHRLGLKKSLPHATTFLWGGDETYIDVFMTNQITATHHRAGALDRGLVPGLKRLTEDHGVCISSCLDHWDDDLILQTFNRNLILSPEIYGNPWLLRDDEFPKLARIFNLHEQYKSILVNGAQLPESRYGSHAMTRGDDTTRILSVKNISWEPKKINLKFDKHLGLATKRSILLKQLFPIEQNLGTLQYDDSITVTVEPFRAALFVVSAASSTEPQIEGTAFELVRNIPTKSIFIDILGRPGAETSLRLRDYSKYRIAKLEGNNIPNLLSGKVIKLKFPGAPLVLPQHRKLASFETIPVPADSKAMYEATVYAADNNALEVRSFERSGPSKIEAVNQARNAFFNQSAFVNRSIWDRNLFDGNFKTGFGISRKYHIDQSIAGGALRIDCGEVTRIDSIKLHIASEFLLQPLLVDEGNYVEYSRDLIHWKRITYLAGTCSVIALQDSLRYLRFNEQPQEIVEIEGFVNGLKVEDKKWRVSNLFAPSDKMSCQKAWKAEFVLPEIAKGSYLCIAITGTHGVEGAYAALKVDGKYVGAADRAPSYPSNTWEYVNERVDKNYTYYIPVGTDFVGKKLEAYVLGFDKKHLDFKPEIWITIHDQYTEKMRLELVKK